MIDKLLKIKDYKITIASNYIYILNYIKIIDISYNSIKIELLKNKINIKGNNLIINKMDEKELLIKGIIKGIEFYEE